ncbi:MAG: VWA domain-containing protein [Oscillospiraceae bacterium]|jgi:Ca-activated chloride channel family protein|nr:VWA domain-containing protein [Oscillospiraceae bacterium]
MKKKLFYLAFAILTILSLCACSAPAAEEAPMEEASATEAPAEGAPAATEAPLAEVPMTEPEAMPDGSNGSYESEEYLVIDENDAVSTDTQSMLTFSLKVDTASYTNVARYIQSGSLPPKDAVRTEEFVNYFNYDEPMKFSEDSPFALYCEVGPSPFNEDRQLAFLRVKSKDIDKSQLPPSNLTFLIDTSGSMDSYDKLPLLREAFGLLVETLTENDRVSIVTYAGSSQVVLDSASGSDRERILSAINELWAGGSTAGADGIMTAYALAEKNFLAGGNNRVILATDGDFNVGLSSTDELKNLVAEKRGNGVYMSILGFGTGNIRDDIMETLSKEGNGNYAYISDLSDAKKVLVEELAANLFTIADDVKAQVEFNPEAVKSYRLIGYENRSLNNDDFENDAKDAGEIGIGTDVVILFELELQGGALDAADPDLAGELFELRIRYKDPGQQVSKLISKAANYSDITSSPSDDLRFASSVAAFGHLLRGSEYTGQATFERVYALAEESLGDDRDGYRREYLELLSQYNDLAG